jgi:hypothetical protein
LKQPYFELLSFPLERRKKSLKTIVCEPELIGQLPFTVNVFKQEKIMQAVHVAVQYPTYYRRYVYSSYFVAVLSDTLAIQVSVVPNDIFLRKGTPNYVFRIPDFEDFLAG